MPELTDVWRSIGAHLLVFTRDTADDIPPSPGIYGWFLPLWLYSEELEKLLHLVAGVMTYDPVSAGAPTRSLSASYNWHQLHLDVMENPFFSCPEKLTESWQSMAADPEAKEVFAQALMLASILLPPLYVGKANNLRVRYQQHTERGLRETGSTFRSRFSDHAKSIGLQLQLGDLLFMCIVIEPDQDERLQSHGLNEVLEKVMMRLCRPPYSIR